MLKYLFIFSCITLLSLSGYFHGVDSIKGDETNLSWDIVTAIASMYLFSLVKFRIKE